MNAMNAPGAATNDAPAATTADPTVLAFELIDLSQSLVQVMASETETLRAGHVAEIEPLQEPKKVLAQICEAHLRQVAANPDLFRGVAPEIRAELARLAGQVDAVARENADAVHAALALNRQLVQVIADAVIESAPSASGYTKTGAAPGAHKGTAIRHAPASLDQRL